MIKVKKYIFILLLLSGCAVSLCRDRSVEMDAGSRGGVDPSDAALVKELLHDQLNEWRAAPYKAGGLSKEGVDCSGFVYVTYLSRFGVKLPRSAKSQASFGIPIHQEDLMPGDLVFFKTGFFTMHVGIYVENRTFIHASTRKGVMKSRLDDDYWSRKYWKAVRVER